MMNKNSKLEWRVAAYMAIWTVAAVLVKWAFRQNIDSAESMIGYSAIGVFCMTAAMVISFVEKHGDAPFLWIKNAPTNQHWAMPGLLGVFTNASSIAAIGIGFMATNFIQLMELYVIIAAMMMLQRHFVELNMNTKAKRMIVGLVVPTIVAVLISVCFFYKNTYEILAALV